jgi:hypothetical protein
MEGLIGDIPWCTGYSSEKFGLISLDDSYVGFSSTFPSMLNKTQNVFITLPPEV